MLRTVLHLCLPLLLLACLCPVQAQAGALDAGPSVEAMRFRSGITILVAPRPLLPTFSATLHYRLGSAHEPESAQGILQIINILLASAPANPADPVPDLEQTLLARADALDTALRRKQAALKVVPDEALAPLQAEVKLLASARDRVLARLALLPLPPSLRAAYARLGGEGPQVEVTPDQIQISVTLPVEALEPFMALQARQLPQLSTRGFYAARQASVAARLSPATHPGLQQLLHLALPAHPYGRLLPDAQALASLARSDAQAFFRNHLHPGNAILSLAGGIHGRDVRALGQRFLSSLEGGPPVPVLNTQDPEPFGTRQLAARGADFLQLQEAYPLHPAGLRPGSPLPAILEALVGWPSVGVIQRLPRQGLAFNVSASLQPGSWPLGSVYPGALLIQASAPATQSPTALEEALHRLLAQLAARPPSEALLQTAVAQVRLRLASAMRNNRQLAQLLARGYALTNDEACLTHFYRSLESVSGADIHALARAIFRPENRAVRWTVPKQTAATFPRRLSPFHTPWRPSWMEARKNHDLIDWRSAANRRLDTGWTRLPSASSRKGL